MIIPDQFFESIDNPSDLPHGQIDWARSKVTVTISCACGTKNVRFTRGEATIDYTTVKLGEIYECRSCGIKYVLGRVVKLIPVDQQMIDSFYRSHTPDDDTIDKEALRLRLRELRKKCHLSQLKIAKEIGVSMTAVSLWENGSTKPTDENAKRWSQYLEKYDEERDKRLAEQKANWEYEQRRLKEYREGYYAPEPKDSDDDEDEEGDL